MNRNSKKPLTRQRRGPRDHNDLGHMKQQLQQHAENGSLLQFEKDMGKESIFAQTLENGKTLLNSQPHDVVLLTGYKSNESSQNATVESISRYIIDKKIYACNIIAVMTAMEDCVNVPGLLQRKGGNIPFRGFAFPYSNMLFVTKEKGSTGLPKFDPLGGGKRTGFVQAAISKILKGRTPWIQTQLDQSALDTQFKNQNIRMATVENVLKYQVISVDENGQAIFPQQNKQMVEQSGQNPTAYLLKQQLNKKQMQNQDSDMFQRKKQETKSAKLAMFYLVTSDRNEVEKWAMKCSKTKTVLARKQGEAPEGTGFVYKNDEQRKNYSMSKKIEQKMSEGSIEVEKLLKQQKRQMAEMQRQFKQSVEMNTVLQAEVASLKKPSK